MTVLSLQTIYSICWLGVARCSDIYFKTIILTNFCGFVKDIQMVFA